MRITAVPVMTTGEAGPPEGSPGEYEVRFILGVPGINSVATALDMKAILHSGDSLLAGSGARIEIEGGPEAVLRANENGHISEVRLTLMAESKLDAERQSHDWVMPILSRLAFEADVALEVKATVVVELSTGTQMMATHVVGSVKLSPELQGNLTSELRPLLAAYRDGLNSVNVLYEALSFYKAVEGAVAFHRSRQRRSTPTGRPAPIEALMPSDEKDLVGVADQTRDLFRPFLGQPMKDAFDAMRDTVRNAVAHLTPGRDLRVPDYYDDVEKCRQAVPVLRYIARRLIEEELRSV